MNGTHSEPEIPLTPASTLAPAPAQHAMGTILLVEDEDFVRQVTCEVLMSAGYEVFTARHSAEAMRAFRQCEKDVQLLLTDVVLPGRNGHNLARDLQALRPALKTVFISGYPENELAKYGLPEMNATYLAKPFSLDSLLRTVQRAFAGDGIAEPRPVRHATAG